MDDETLTPEIGTENEITQPEAPAPAEAPQEDPAAVLRAELEAERQAREAAERKFSESTREAQILAAKNKALESRQTNNQPTEDDLRKAFPSYDYMTDTEKDLARGTYIARASADEVLAEKRQRDEEALWTRQVTEFTLTDPKLLGKEEDFKKFANKPSHRGAPLDVLKAAFLYETPVKQVTAAPALETASAGPGDTAPKGITAERAMELRKNSPKEFYRLLREGKLKNLEE